MNSYSVNKHQSDFKLSKNWNNREWKNVPALFIDQFLPQSSGHHPETQVKLLYDNASIHVFFRVKDRYVRSVHTGYMAKVCNDSCVEWFVQPKKDKGYFAFEVNCGGSLNASYVEDPARRPDRSLTKSTPLPAEISNQIAIYHSLPDIVDPEITEPTEWLLELSVPLKLFEYYLGPLFTLSGQAWRANFNKCADQTSHPHWATWNPVSEKNFHRPEEFGEIRFLLGL